MVGTPFVPTPSAIPQKAAGSMIFSGDRALRRGGRLIDRSQARPVVSLRCVRSGTTFRDVRSRARSRIDAPAIATKTGRGLSTAIVPANFALKSPLARRRAKRIVRRQWLWDAGYGVSAGCERRAYSARRNAPV